MSRILWCSILAIIVAMPLPLLAADEVVVYSSRKEHLIKPLFDAYTEKTGVRVRYITDKAGPLLQRLRAEGSRTPADVFMTVDAGNLWQAADNGVLASIDSEALRQSIPAHLRDPESRWFGLSVRARTLVFSTERLKRTDLTSYENLADPKWRGRLCLRTSKKVYNQSLVATMIVRHGEAKAEDIVRGWVANLAAPPYSNDTKAMQAVAAGQCDVTIVNTYYFGRLQKKQPDTTLGIAWPNQASSGVHVNVSGAGVTRHAKNTAGAVRLLEFLASDEAQRIYAGLNYEFPANPSVPPDPAVQRWGTFKADVLNVSEAGRLQATAIRLMDRAGYK